jgi:hypothetical protein
MSEIAQTVWAMIGSAFDAGQRTLRRADPDQVIERPPFRVWIGRPHRVGEVGIGMAPDDERREDLELGEPGRGEVARDNTVGSVGALLDGDTHLSA